MTLFCVIYHLSLAGVTASPRPHRHPLLPPPRHELAVPRITGALIIPHYVLAVLFLAPGPSRTLTASRRRLFAAALAKVSGCRYMMKDRRGAGQGGATCLR